MIDKLLKPNYFFSNVIIPLSALVLYCVTFAYFSSHYLTEGVNYYFVSKLKKYLLFAIAGAVLVFGLLFVAGPNRSLKFKELKEKFYIGDLFLLLLPLTPVAQYVLRNQGILKPTDSLYVLIIFFLFSSVYILIIPALVNVAVPSRTLAIIGLSFVFTIVSMSLVSAYYKWFEIGALRKQLTVFGIVFLVVWLLYNLGQRKILYFFVVANFVLNSSSILLSQPKNKSDSSVSPENNKLLALVGDTVPATKPNVYLLVYDAYVPNETMLAYGIDNSAQESYLVDQGFTLYPHTYSIGAASAVTMSRVLNASSDYYGDMRRGVSGDGVVQNMLKHLGYETYGIFPSDYMFRGVGSSYDHSIPRNSVPMYVQLSKAIFVGEFRFDIENVGFTQQSREQFIEAKRDVFKSLPGDQAFIYTHSNFPSHTQNSGACLPDETDLFRGRLDIANAEMQQDIDQIVQDDPTAIVIVAGDHGPYLTKNCYTLTDAYDASDITRLDIQDRYGTFLAIRWPTQGFASYDDITVLQDVFPAIFAYLYHDPSILGAKVPSKTLPDSISSVYVENGTIHGGKKDGEPLYLSGQ
ncbi:MAG: hypothetical protein QM730_19815 [Anaerolineales bacterium]